MKPFWLVLSAGLLSSCGGGGGGGDGDGVVDIPDLPPTILPSYNFEIGSVQPGTDMTVDVGGELQVGVDFGDTLRGSVNLLDNTPTSVSFLNFVTDAGSTMSVSVADIQKTLNGTFTINITSDVIAGLGVEPSGGAFEVLTADDIVTVTFNPFGVELSLNGAEPIALSWEAYGDLLDDAQAETWQRLASLAGGTFAFIFDRMFEIADLLDELELTESAIPIVTSCDEFPGVPPEGVLLQGENVLTRLGSGEDLTPGDVFDWTFTNCWFASSNAMIDNFLQMQNYIEVIDSSNTLTRIGFGPDNNMSGGILYFDWTIAETQENAGVYTIDPAETIEVNGGFSMVFTQP